MVVGRLFRKHRTAQQEDHQWLRVAAQESRESMQRSRTGTRMHALMCTRMRAHTETHSRMSAAMLFFSSGGHGSLQACTPSGPRCEACGTGGVWKKSHLGSWRRGPGAVRHPRLADNGLADRSRMTHCMLRTNHCLQSKSGSRNSPWPPTAAPRPGRSYCRRGPVLRKKCE